jgi:hypothetical protein
MWNYKGTFAIGGLFNVGYASNKELLMVLSSQGQGIFDCHKGEKIARLYNDLDWVGFDDTTNSVVGFDCLQDEVIYTSGLYGGDHLLKATNDGWSLIAAEPVAAPSPFGTNNITNIYLLHQSGDHKILVAKDGACELRSFGFSDTGRSFVVATSCDLIIYSRDLFA